MKNIGKNLGIVLLAFSAGCASPREYKENLPSASNIVEITGTDKLVTEYRDNFSSAYELALKSYQSYKSNKMDQAYGVNNVASERSAKAFRDHIGEMNLYIQRLNELGEDTSNLEKLVSDISKDN